ncbi:hypothetical protein N7449_003716 [Penicillium cf. viridicatum]|uniref:ADP-ribosylation factor n=1 Tax=Penicillium cf. viridicatum TaxID=2972119 RepID=A0A9W9MXH7_9EURO|nr:hypothetical protein N7449_003716 [Penicillium cf. viridicatum]
MGTSLSHLLPSRLLKTEYRILMKGPWYPGKTTILYSQLMKLGPIKTVDTFGFNVETVAYNRDVDLVVWDLGGRDKMRPIWASSFSDLDAIIFVVDSTEIDRLDDAAFELRYLLDFEGVRDVHAAPLLVFANKQDLEGSKMLEEISEALKLEEFRDREWKTIACSAVDGSGIAEGMDWLVQCLQSKKT